VGDSIECGIPLAHLQLHLGISPLLKRHEGHRLHVEVQAEERLKGKHQQVQGTSSRKRRPTVARLELRVRPHREAYLTPSDPGHCMLQRLGDQADGRGHCLSQRRRRIGY